MKQRQRDVTATILVAVAAVLYVLWIADATLPGLEGVRATGIIVLALGFAASAIAVVPGFDALWRGNRLYLVGTSAVGIVALAAGIQMLVASSDVGLAVLIGAMAVLWLVTTTHHWKLATAPSRHVPDVTPGQGRPA